MSVNYSEDSFEGNEKNPGGIHLKPQQRRYVLLAGTILAVYLGMRYISPVLSPFLLAFLIAGALNPFLCRLNQRTGLKRPLLAGIVIFLCCVLLILLLWGASCLLMEGGSRLAMQIPGYQKEFSVLLKDCCKGIEDHFGMDGVVIENFILEQADILIENLEVQILPTVMGRSVDCMKGLGGFIGFLAVVIIAVIFVVKDYEKLSEGIKRITAGGGIIAVGKKVLEYIKTFLRAQILILVIISSICAVTLRLMGMKGGIWYGLFTGFMDMLPFIGTGIMLVPLALLRLLNGNYVQALICVLLYGTCALIRQFLEPRLIGNRMGILPVGILFSVFAGLKLFGIAGIVKGPLSLVIICETCKYLWK